MPHGVVSPKESKGGDDREWSCPLFSKATDGELKLSFDPLIVEFDNEWSVTPSLTAGLTSTLIDDDLLIAGISTVGIFEGEGERRGGDSFSIIVKRGESSISLRRVFSPMMGK